MKICEDLKLYNNSDKYLDLIKHNQKSEGAIKCFMYDLEDYMNKTNGQTHLDPKNVASVC